MATVSQTPSLLELKQVFGGDGSFASYYRGGPYVPNIPANAAISATIAGLALSQFRGATNYINVTASNSGTIHGSNSQKGTWPVGTNTATGGNGTGSYTYTLSYVSGYSGFNITRPTGNSATFTYTAITTGVTGISAVYRWTVSDGTTSATTDFIASFN